MDAITEIITIAAIAGADSRSLPITPLMTRRQLALHLLLTIHAWRSAPDEVRQACLQELAAQGWPDLRHMHMAVPGTSSSEEALTVIQEKLLGTLAWSVGHLQHLWQSISQLVPQFDESTAVPLLVCRSAPRWDDCQRLLNLPVT